MRSTKSVADLQATTKSMVSDSSSDSDSDSTASSVFDVELLSRWNSLLEGGKFRYDVTKVPTKKLDGKFNFIMQLNLGRAAKKRPTEFSADRVVQSFDPNKFNFTKARQSELLFQFETCAMKKSPSMASFDDLSVTGASPNCVLINVSPIEYGHVLLVPRILDCLPQQLDASVMHLALRMAAESDNRFFRVGFNSLGAYATINHLHFQGYYLYEDFPIERAATTHLFSIKSGVEVSATVDYPVRILVADGSRANFTEFSAVLATMCEHFQQNNMPYNIFVCNSGCRVFVIPQLFSIAAANGEIPEDLLDTQVNPAVFEIAGHMVLKREEDYQTMDETMACRLLNQASLLDHEFNECAKHFQALFSA